MYIYIESNPNCTGEERVFATNGDPKPVLCVQIEQNGSGALWWEVIGVEEMGVFIEATAHLVDDSADGTAWLIRGGTWGLRFRRKGNTEEWNLNNKNQWGTPFLVLDSGAKEIDFKKSE